MRLPIPFLWNLWHAFTHSCAETTATCHNPQPCRQFNSNSFSIPNAPSGQRKWGSAKLGMPQGEIDGRTAVRLGEAAENSHSSSWQRKSFPLLHFAVIFLRTSVKLPWKSTDDSESTQKMELNDAITVYFNIAGMLVKLWAGVWYRHVMTEWLHDLLHSSIAGEEDEVVLRNNHIYKSFCVLFTVVHTSISLVFCCYRL